MENDEKIIGLIENKNIDPYLSNTFKPDYDNQNLEMNSEYQKWKSSMFDKYGNEGKIFKCSRDKILFFAPKQNVGNNNINVCRCPLCKKRICFYCSKASDHFGNCCLRKKLCDMIKGGKAMSNAQIGDLGDYETAAFTNYLIPGLNIVFFIGIIYNFSFYKLAMKNNNEYPYETFLHHHKIRFGIILALNSFCAILLAISFIVYGILLSFMFLMFIIFKKSFYMFIIGFCNEDWIYLYKNLHKVCRCL